MFCLKKELGKARLASGYLMKSEETLPDFTWFYISFWSEPEASSPRPHCRSHLRCYSQSWKFSAQWWLHDLCPAGQIFPPWKFNHTCKQTRSENKIGLAGAGDAWGCHGSGERTSMYFWLLSSVQHKENLHKFYLPISSVVGKPQVHAGLVPQQQCVDGSCFCRP